MSTNLFARQAASYKNELNRSLGALLGIAQGLLCDGHISDQEIRFLENWLSENEVIATTWPGDVIHARIRDAIADGVITIEEREYLTQTLQMLIGGTLESISQQSNVTELALDRDALVVIPNAKFCMTGDFAYAPRILMRSSNKKTRRPNLQQYHEKGGVLGRRWPRQQRMEAREFWHQNRKGSRI